jgi:D-aminoacyl-tRNA deacylase
MNYCIVTSKKDIASMNILDYLLKNYDFKKENNGGNNKGELYHLGEDKLWLDNEDSIYLEDIDKTINSDFFLFASGHESSKSQKILSVHAPGNFGRAEFGGQASKLCYTSGSLMKKAMSLMSSIAKEKNLEYSIVQEATHHGPYIQKPCLFIEIGSSIEEWKDTRAGEVVSRTLIELINLDYGAIKNQFKQGIILGGQHISERGTKAMLRTDYAFSHICAKYAVSTLSLEQIKDMTQKNMEGIKYILLDDLGEDKDRVTNMVQNQGFEVAKLKSIIK